MQENKLKHIMFNEKKIRITLDEKNEIWFLSKDICNILGLTDVASSLQRIDNEEKLLRKIFISGQNRDTWTINEKGLYSLTLSSNKEEAKHFKKWIMSDDFKNKIEAIKDTTPNNDITLKTFFYGETGIRVFLDKNGEPLFCLYDVCGVLGLENPAQVSQKLESAGIIQNYISTPIGKRNVLFINEPNLYQVIFRSDKPEAKKFQNWVFKDVLPTIRKTGSYSLPAVETLSPAKQFLRIAQMLSDHEDKMIEMNARITTIEDTQKEAMDKLNTLPVSTQPAEELSTRSKINMLVRNYSIVHNLNIQDVWKKLYVEFKYRYHFDVFARSKSSPDKSKLDIIEEYGLMEELFATATCLFEQKKDMADNNLLF